MTNQNWVLKHNVTPDASHEEKCGSKSDIENDKGVTPNVTLEEREIPKNDVIDTIDKGEKESLRKECRMGNGPSDDRKESVDVNHVLKHNPPPTEQDGGATR
jgi:hypothetical protein